MSLEKEGRQEGARLHFLHPSPSCISVDFHSAGSLAHVTHGHSNMQPHRQSLPCPYQATVKSFVQHRATLIYTYFMSSVVNPSVSKSKRPRKLLVKARGKRAVYWVWQQAGGSSSSSYERAVVTGQVIQEVSGSQETGDEQ